jgi:type VII secretion-associated serine protease mycosin
VTVAVIDDGVNGNHPDLTGSVLPGVDLLSPPLSRDGRADDDGHGTAMAGLIAAHGQVLGIAPQAKILPVRAVPGDNSLSPPRLIDGINWAIDHGASVINISAGEHLNSIAERNAIDRALASNVVVVASAGNRPEDASVDYPAAYPGVVAVGGVDRAGNHAAGSVTGSEIVLCAPSVDIYSTGLHGGYRTGVGTSDAAAIVSGVVALIRSKFPTMSAQEVVHRLEATADDRGPPGRDDLYGYGIVDPVKALTADVPPLTPSATAQSTTPATAGKTSDGGNRTPIVLIVVGVLVVVGLVTAGLATRRR